MSAFESGGSEAGNADTNSSLDNLQNSIQLTVISLVPLQPAQPFAA
jgi:hypothetical protein